MLLKQVDERIGLTRAAGVLINPRDPGHIHWPESVRAAALAAGICLPAE